MLDQHRPDVLLIDLGLPDIEAIEAGATGYLLKDACLQRIVGRILELRDGGAPIGCSGRSCGPTGRQ